MKLVIDIDEKTYNEIMDDAKNTPRNLSHYERIIAKSIPLGKIREVVNEWQSDTWTDNLSYECMVKIAKLVEPQESIDVSEYRGEVGESE